MESLVLNVFFSLGRFTLSVTDATDALASQELHFVLFEQ